MPCVKDVRDVHRAMIEVTDRWTAPILDKRRNDLHGILYLTLPAQRKPESASMTEHMCSNSAEINRKIIVSPAGNCDRESLNRRAAAEFHTTYWYT